eukprot:IDg9899t1
MGGSDTGSKCDCRAHTTQKGIGRNGRGFCEGRGRRIGRKNNTSLAVGRR